MRLESSLVSNSGSILDSIITSIADNWVVILITVIVTLLATVISNWGFKKHVESAKQKEQQRALEDLRTILEDLIVNNREDLVQDDSDLNKIGLSPERIEDLIEAIQREYQVSLPESVTPLTLLQDVDLRIKDSRHLDPNQKNQYSAAIATIIDEVREQETEYVSLPEEGAEALDQIEERASYPGYQQDIEELKRNIITSESSHSPSGFESSRLYYIFSIMVGFGILVLWGLLLESARFDPSIRTLLGILAIVVGVSSGFALTRKIIGSDPSP